MENAEQKTNKKNILIRILAIGLLLFFLFFGMEMKSGYCFGVEVFHSLGLSPWSLVNQGWFYPGILSITGALASIILFSFATKDRMKTFSYFMIGALAVGIGCSVLSLHGVI